MFTPLEFTDTSPDFFIARIESTALVPAVLLATKLENADEYSRPSFVSSRFLSFSCCSGKLPIRFRLAASILSSV